jgi:PAS domain-containing protein
MLRIWVFLGRVRMKHSGSALHSWKSLSAVQGPMSFPHWIVQRGCKKQCRSPRSLQGGGCLGRTQGQSKLAPDGRPYPMAECPIDRALPENFEVRAHEDVFFRKDGSRFLVACAASPIFKNGRAIATVIEIQDVTERKRKDEELRESERRAIEAAQRSRSVFHACRSRTRYCMARQAGPLWRPKACVSW